MHSRISQNSLFKLIVNWLLVAARLERKLMGAGAARLSLGARCGGMTPQHLATVVACGLTVLSLSQSILADEFARQATDGLPPVVPAYFFQIEEMPELPLLRMGPELDLGLLPDRPKGDDKESKKKHWFDKLSITGYAQFRYNHTTYLADGSAPATHAGDSSIGENQSFLIRRARLILASNVSDHLFVYLQPDFASTPPGSQDSNQFAQIRDWYGDIYLDKDRVNRIRVGQSKIPYGWENMQSSSRRLPLDRNDAFNSAVRNERDLGILYYWTPRYVQETFLEIQEKGLKGSGNYGAFGIGIYNGQGGSFREQNDGVHLVSRFTWPFKFASGQILELGIQGYTGDYVVLGAPIHPLGFGPSAVPLGTRDAGGRQGLTDQRLGWTAVYYPQPLGFQVEWTVGRGPALNAAQNAVEIQSLSGGYAMVMYQLNDFHGTWTPFGRYSFFDGGYKSAINAPQSYISEFEVGLEWEPRKDMRLNMMYTFTDRTNLQALSGGRQSYDQFVGQIWRTQLQINY
ncbi:porin [Pirellulaceae bacterium SH449]